MRYNVPKFVNIDDRIAFRMTAKQLGWFAIAGVFMFLAYNIFNLVFFIIISVLLLIVASAFAFLKPQSLSLVSFLGYGFGFFAKPKEYFWFRKDLRDEPQRIKKKTLQEDQALKEEREIKEKQKTMGQIEELSHILDEKSDI